MKKLLLIGWFFYPKLGGAETVMLNQAKYFVDQGYDVSVLTSGEEDGKLGKVKIYRRNYINTSIEFNSAAVVKDLEKIFAVSRPDIVHFHNGSYPVASNDIPAGVKNIVSLFDYFKKNGSVVIEHTHNAQLERPDLTEPLRNLKWDCLICVSDYVRRSWQKLGTGAKKIEVVHNGIELKLFENSEKSLEMAKLKKSGEQIIFFPARVISMRRAMISEQKNFILLLRACKILLGKGLDHFRLIAILNRGLQTENTKKAYDELDREIKNNNLGQHIDFLPEVLPAEMPCYYAAADIVCIPSINETFGLVYIEAMAAGKIAIASNTGGPKEYIKNGENGFLVDPQDPNDLALVLEKLVTDNKLRDRISLNGATTVREFSALKTMEKIEQIYIELLEAK